MSAFSINDGSVRVDAGEAVSADVIVLIAGGVNIYAVETEG